MQQPHPHPPTSAVCEEHGLRFDRNSQGGCVLCRKATPQGSSLGLKLTIFGVLVMAGVAFAAIVGVKKILPLLNPPPIDARVMPIEGAVGLVGDNRGKVVVLHIWATWCGTCRRELPAIERATRSIRPQDLALLMLVLDTSRPELARFGVSNQLPGTLVSVLPYPRGNLTRAVGSVGGTYRNAVPYTAIFARDGRLVDEWTGGQDEQSWRAALQEPLAAR